MKFINKIKKMLVKEEEKKNLDLDEYTRELLNKNAELINRMNAKIAGY